MVLTYSATYSTKLIRDHWPLKSSEAGGGLALIQTSASVMYVAYIAQEQLDLHNKSSEVFIKTRSPPASLPLKGQVTEQASVKWSIPRGVLP